MATYRKGGVKPFWPDHLQSLHECVFVLMSSKERKTCNDVRIYYSMKKKKVIVVSSLAAATLALGITTYMLIESTLNQDSSYNSNPIVIDQSKINGWWTPGVSMPREEVSSEYSGDKENLPLSSGAIYQGTRGSIDNCFILVDYYDHPIKDDFESKRFQDSILSQNPALTIQNIGNRSLSMQTSRGHINYTLKVHEVHGESNEKIMRGVASAQILHQDSFLDVRINCADAKDLEEAFPTLQAISVRF